MDIKICIPDSSIEKQMKASIESFLGSNKGLVYLDKLLEKKIDSVISDRFIKDLVQDRIARLITVENLKGISGEYKIEDYNNRMAEIFSNIMLKSPEFKKLLTDKIKSTIKIG